MLCVRSLVRFSGPWRAAAPCFAAYGRKRGSICYVRTISRRLSNIHSLSFILLCACALTYILAYIYMWVFIQCVLAPVYAVVAWKLFSWVFSGTQAGAQTAPSHRAWKKAEGLLCRIQFKHYISIRILSKTTWISRWACLFLAHIRSSMLSQRMSKKRGEAEMPGRRLLFMWLFNQWNLLA